MAAAARASCYESVRGSRGRAGGNAGVMAADRSRPGASSVCRLSSPLGRIPRALTSVTHGNRKILLSIIHAGVCSSTNFSTDSNKNDDHSKLSCLFHYITTSSLSATRPVAARWGTGLAFSSQFRLPSAAPPRGRIAARRRSSPRRRTARGPRSRGTAGARVRTPPPLRLPAR